jgi:hypothetical protein
MERAGPPLWGCMQRVNRSIDEHLKKESDYINSFLLYIMLETLLEGMSVHFYSEGYFSIFKGVNQ